MILAARGVRVHPVLVTMVPTTLWWQPGTWDPSTVVAAISVVVAATVGIWAILSAIRTERLLKAQLDNTQTLAEYTVALERATNRLVFLQQFTRYRIEASILWEMEHALKELLRVLTKVVYGDGENVTSLEIQSVNESFQNVQAAQIHVHASGVGEADILSMISDLLDTARELTEQFTNPDAGAWLRSEWSTVISKLGLRRVIAAVGANWKEAMIRLVELSEEQRPRT